MWSLQSRCGRLAFFATSMFGGFMTGAAWLAIFIAKLHEHSTPAITALFMIVLAAGSWITFAACIRRLHDIGWSGWWILLAPIPLAGLCQALMLTSMPGQRADNRFGPPPGGAPAGSGMLTQA